MVPQAEVLAAMRFTATFQGRIEITESSSSVDRTLSEDDFEFMLDSFSDALIATPGSRICRLVHLFRPAS